MRRIRCYAVCLLILGSILMAGITVHRYLTVIRDISHLIEHTQQLTTLRNVTTAAPPVVKLSVIKQPHVPCQLSRTPVYYIDETASKPFTNIVIPDIQGISSPEEDLVREFSFQPRYPSYPMNGTGVTVDISNDFDESVFNSFCESSPGLKAVLPVYSAPDRFEHRRLLRESLGELAKSLNCRMFFILGVSMDDTVNAMLKEEYVREKDILMIDKLDTYRDLNNKAYAMIAWISKHCSKIPYTIHLIDDTYINLSWFLQELSQTKGDNFILAPLARTRTIRTEEPHSFVTVEEYVHNMFPEYAYGFAYAFRSSVASRLLTAAHSAKYCWIEDIWIGGHVRAAADVVIKPVHHFGVTLRKYPKRIPKAQVWHKAPVERLCQWYRHGLPH